MMHVRIKRKASTIFMHVEPSDNFATIKQRCGDLFGVPGSSVMLFASDKTRELIDLASISDVEIGNDAVLYMVLKREGSDMFEAIDVEPFETLGEASAAPE